MYNWYRLVGRFLLEDQKNAIKLRLDWFAQRDQLLVEKRRRKPTNYVPARFVSKMSPARIISFGGWGTRARSLYDAVVSAGRTLTDKESHCKRLAQDTTLATEGKERSKASWIPQTNDIWRRRSGSGCWGLIEKSPSVGYSACRVCTDFEGVGEFTQELTAYYDKEQEKLTQLSCFVQKTTDSIAALEKWRTRYLAKASIAEQLPLLRITWTGHLLPTRI